jgi:tRNA pseudouridine38-40 synthase
MRHDGRTRSVCSSRRWLSCLLVHPAFSLQTTATTTGPASIRYRARVAYDGAGFQGFQVQGGQKRTVQLVLEQALSQRFNEPVRVIAAGRTDSGVHARGQAIHFDLSGHDLGPNELNDVDHSMRKMLTQDLRLYSLQRAPPPIIKFVDGVERLLAWNVMYDSTGKLYSYRLSLGGVMHPLDRYNRWHPDLSAQGLDRDRLPRILQHFVGTHDFRAFAGAMDAMEKKLEQPLNSERTVYSIAVVQESNTYFRIDIHLKGALYKQVRNMVGAALDVCQGRVTEDYLLDLLNDATKTRKHNRSKPAPPQGLTLEQVYFDDVDF